MGRDKRGRPCATEAVFVDQRRRFSFVPLLIVAVLLILPTLAALTLPYDGRWLIAYALAVSLITFFAYSEDKKRARGNAWRIPETKLHLLELIGGWPGAYLAQRWLRHKCSKPSFLVTFWLIVLLFELLSFDCLEGWQYTSQAWQAFCAFAESSRDSQAFSK